MPLDTALGRILDYKGISAVRLATATGISYRTIRRVLHGRPLPADEKARICRALSITEDQLARL